MANNKKASSRKPPDAEHRSRLIGRGPPWLPSSAEPKQLTKEGYDQELERLQIELVRLQEWVQDQGLRVVVIFEGRDTAGKGGTIKRIIERLNARYCRVVALDKPTERERTQWYFQRYIPYLPAAGEIVLFDRSWYNRAGVEKVMGFCTRASTTTSCAPAPRSSGRSCGRGSSSSSSGCR